MKQDELITPSRVQTTGKKHRKRDQMTEQKREGDCIDTQHAIVGAETAIAPQNEVQSPQQKEVNRSSKPMLTQSRPKASCVVEESSHCFTHACVPLSLVVVLDHSLSSPP